MDKPRFSDAVSKSCLELKCFFLSNFQSQPNPCTVQREQKLISWGWSGGEHRLCPKTTTFSFPSQLCYVLFNRTPPKLQVIRFSLSHSLLKSSFWGKDVETNTFLERTNNSLHCSHLSYFIISESILYIPEPSGQGLGFVSCSSRTVNSRNRENRA